MICFYVSYQTVLYLLQRSPAPTRHNLSLKKICVLKLAYNAHYIEAVATKFKSGDWGVEVTIEWIEDSQEILENEKKFSPYEIFSSQNGAESWGMLGALRWIDTSKPNTETLVTLH